MNRIDISKRIDYYSGILYTLLKDMIANKDQYTSIELKCMTKTIDAIYKLKNKLMEVK